MNSPTDRLEKVLRVLRFAKCASSVFYRTSPISGGAVGRGGNSNGYISLLGLGFKVSGLLATGYRLLSTGF